MLRSYVAISTLLHQIRKNTSGVTAIEYGLIAGLISVVIITAVTAIGTDLKTAFQTIQNSLAGVN